MRCGDNPLGHNFLDYCRLSVVMEGFAGGVESEAHNAQCCVVENAFSNEWYNGCQTTRPPGCIRHSSTSGKKGPPRHFKMDQSGWKEASTEK